MGTTIMRVSLVGAELSEVPEGAWGLGGEPVSIGKLAPVFAEDRQQRIRDYLEGQWSARR